MRVATFNCNSVRSRLGILLDWLAAKSPDALALQETKCVDADFPAEAFLRAGWKVFFRGEKAYNGVAWITRAEPSEVAFGLEDGRDEPGRDSAVRLARISLGGLRLLNAYVPQGEALDSPKFRFKLDWLARFRRFLDRFDPRRDPVLWVGDLNVAPEPRDVWDSKKVWPHVCHGPEVCEAFAAATAWGFEDVLRKHLPGDGVFTFWDYRVPRALDRNLGWRIDHVLATPPLAARSRSVEIDLEPRRREKPSDHTFVLAEFADHA